MKELFIGNTSDLTKIFSIAYLMIFLPISIFVYTKISSDKRRYALLVLSLIFYTLISGPMIIYFLAATMYIYKVGLWIERLKTAAVRRVVLITTIILNCGILLLLNIFVLGKRISSIYIPVGMSFLALQMFSYLSDIYYKKISADKNFARLLLFFCFFPQRIMGPVCRYKETADLLWECEDVNYYNFKRGFTRIFWGFFKKLVIADRLTILTKEVFEYYKFYSGGIIFCAAFAYLVQVYMGFSGTMDAINGSAEIFGIKFPENFRQPYLSKSIYDLCKRFNITLSRWVRDYIFIPIVRHKKKYFNLLIPVALLFVWIGVGMCNGLSKATFRTSIYFYVIMLVGLWTKNIKRFLEKRLHLKKSRIYGAIQLIITYAIVLVGGILYKTGSYTQTFECIKRIFRDFVFPHSELEWYYYMGIDIKDIIVIIIAIIIVVTVGILYEKGYNVREWLFSLRTPVRWTLLYILIFVIIIFGAYGGNYVADIPLNMFY